MNRISQSINQSINRTNQPTHPTRSLTTYCKRALPHRHQEQVKDEVGERHRHSGRGDVRGGIDQGVLGPLGVPLPHSRCDLGPGCMDAVVLESAPTQPNVPTYLYI